MKIKLKRTDFIISTWVKKHTIEKRVRNIRQNGNENKCYIGGIEEKNKLFGFNELGYIVPLSKLQLNTSFGGTLSSERNNYFGIFYSSVL